MESVPNAPLDSRGSCSTGSTSLQSHDNIYNTPPSYLEYNRREAPELEMPATTSSAMDMLCDIFNGEHETLMASMVQDKASVLDMLHCSREEPKMTEAFGDELKNNISPQSVVDARQFKLPPLTEQESEDLVKQLACKNVGGGAATYNSTKASLTRRNLEAELVSKGGGVQRRTHITVERNRRKQMNEQLAILRSLMPGSYVQRGDQASIIGGVVEFVKELQQLVARLEAQKRRRSYSCSEASPRGGGGGGGCNYGGGGAVGDLAARSTSPLAEVEVRLLEGANLLLRTRSRRRTSTSLGQLRHLVAALEQLSLHILHLHVSTVHDTVVYVFTLKIEIDCRLSVDDLATTVQQIFRHMHTEQLLQE